MLNAVFAAGPGAGLVRRHHHGDGTQRQRHGPVRPPRLEPDRREAGLAVAAAGGAAAARLGAPAAARVGALRARVLRRERRVRALHSRQRADGALRGLQHRL